MLLDWIELEIKTEQEISLKSHPYCPVFPEVMINASEGLINLFISVV